MSKISKCKYCNQRYNEPIYDNEEDLLGVKIGDKYSNNSLIIYNIKKRHLIKINYCPMCGRKLLKEE